MNNSEENTNFGFMIGEELYIEFDENQIVGEDDEGNIFINTRVYKVISVNGQDPKVEAAIAPEDMTDDIREKVEAAVNSLLESAIDGAMKAFEQGKTDFMVAEDGTIEVEVEENNEKDNKNE